jgi:hypothetical protein
MTVILTAIAEHRFLKPYINIVVAVNNASFV